MTIPISVTIPVGPHPANKRWLLDCVESVVAQSYPADEILLIDDQANLDLTVFDTVSNWLSLNDGEGLQTPGNVRIWPTPWLSGVAHAFNFGVALARNDLVVMLGSDDLLEPWALEDLAASFEKAKREPLGYYAFALKYMDTGEEQNLPCNAAAVTKQLWKHNGGFPVESAIGAPDTMLLSIMMANPEAGKIIKIDSKQPPYLYRRHPETDTATRPSFPLTAIRDTLTKNWRRRHGLT